MMTWQKLRFILKMAKEKNAQAFGVRCTGWLDEAATRQKKIKNSV